MVSKIEDLTNVLKSVRENFQAAVVIAEENKKKELETLKDGYIKGSKPYEEKKQQIELDYDVAVVKARKEAAERAGEAIEDVREWEVSRVGRIDEVSIAKINAIKDIPLTANELKVILDKHGISNYWVQRSIAAIAEQNGIPQTDLNIDSSLDTKLSVLNQLNSQLEKMLEHFTLDGKLGLYDKEASNARWLYLNDDILGNAIDIYNNGLREVSEMDAATQAFYKIKATTGQMQKGVMIANAMRNLKREDAKNIFLYRLSMEDDISSSAYEVAGIADIMGEWKAGKNDRYIRAGKMMDKLKTETDTEKIKDTLRNYMARVDNGTEQENEFLSKALAKTHKRNSSIGKALSEMSGVERNTLLRNNAEPEQTSSATA